MPGAENAPKGSPMPRPDGAVCAACGAICGDGPVWAVWVVLNPANGSLNVLAGAAAGALVAEGISKRPAEGAVLVGAFEADPMENISLPPCAGESKSPECMVYVCACALDAVSSYVCYVLVQKNQRTNVRPCTHVIELFYIMRISLSLLF
jgi:hypothetical protein